MYESVDSSAIEVALGKLAAVRRALQAIDPATLSREQLLELAAVLETDTRRAATVMHAVVTELEMRGGSRSSWVARPPRSCSPNGCGSAGGRPLFGCGWPLTLLLAGRCLVSGCRPGSR
jgi:hypothetical protein